VVPAARDEIIAFLDELLDVDAFDDYGPHGLQVPGRREVAKVVTGVSGQLQLFERAAAAGADLVLVHHGILWDFHPRRIDERMARRLAALLGPQISLAAYHLPLDAHEAHGNNALIADGLGCLQTGRTAFGHHRGRPLGVSGHLPGDGIGIDELSTRIEALCARAPLVLPFGPAQIRTLGVVSGAAASSLREAIDLGLDAFITGEPAEYVLADAREAGIHFIAAGHYATETFGIRRLGDLAAERFGISHEFIDLPNPI
jgi:dinuclear metal center YbgI/SA1388 family protein